MVNWLGRYDRACDGRLEPEPVHYRRGAREPGDGRGPSSGRGSDPQLGRAAWVDGAGHDVAEPGRRDRGLLRRGFSTVQPGPREPDWRLLLVGLGPHLRPDCDPLRLGAA